MNSKESVKVTVVVDDAHKDSLGKVTQALQKKGFVLERSLGEIGVLSGTVAKAAVSGLSTVKGVSTVEQDRDDYRTQE